MSELVALRFGFKETKKKDANGKVVKDDKGEEVKIPAPPPVTLNVPQFNSVDDVLAILSTSEIVDEEQDDKSVIKVEKSKQVNLLFEALNNIVNDQAKQQIDEARAEGKNMWPTIEKTEKTAPDGKKIVEEKVIEEADLSWFDAEKLSWDYISSLPPKTRGQSGIPEEQWDAFKADYIEVIQHHGKTKEQAEQGAAFLAGKFAKVKGNKKVVKSLRDNLLIWCQNSSKGKDLQDVYENLIGKANAILEADEDAIVASV